MGSFSFDVKSHTQIIDMHSLATPVFLVKSFFSFTSRWHQTDTRLVLFVIYSLSYTMHSESHPHCWFFYHLLTTSQGHIQYTIIWGFTLDCDWNWNRTLWHFSKSKSSISSQIYYQTLFWKYHAPTRVRVSTCLPRDQERDVTKNLCQLFLYLFM